jgi:hypothetical protein
MPPVTKGSANALSATIMAALEMDAPAFAGVAATDRANRDNVFVSEPQTAPAQAAIPHRDRRNLMDPKAYLAKLMH